MPKSSQPEHKAIIANVIKFCDKEKNEGEYSIPIARVLDRATAITGKSSRTVMRIRKEMPSMVTKASTKIKKNKGGRPKKVTLDNMQICKIRHTVLNLYQSREEIPSLKALHSIIVKEQDFNGSRELLRHILKDIGYTSLLTCKNRRLIEHYEITVARLKYIKQISLARDKGPPILFVSEHNIRLDESLQWNVLNASFETRLSTDAALVYRFNKSEEKSISHFTKWLNVLLNQFLRNPSIIVVQRQIYIKSQVNKAPASNDSKESIRNWLTQNSVEFEEGLNKAELLTIVGKNKETPIYAIEESLTQFGHEILIMPEHHYDLNPLEVVWNKIANHFNNIQTNTSVDELKSIYLDKCNKIESGEWQDICKSVKSVEAKYFKKDCMIDKINL